ncbi:putative glycosylphosphatidylinositol-alpha 1,2 mannosyltransferase [Ascoidea rubescens DSM 1968]|uniref:Mannosyltransferase n=1 Tax=Ascoidea rubescens DSM 1968 TaxID=1344418 RepID=A0A1D2VP92_9ASCO|nr:glycosyltransferase family 22 protein [Ascoidea rubescens DSM 1968]ODV63430.1 glycosyltransferase family 22 protein [Ascoidea rubescens DSM 1968]
MSQKTDPVLKQRSLVVKNDSISPLDASEKKVPQDQSKPEVKKAKEIINNSLPPPIVLQYLITLRIINAFTINTFFQPDEYFQSLEPAHFFVYGYGELTWEWLTELRNFNYPFIYSLLYQLSEFFDLGYTGVYILPKLFNGIIAGISDYCLYYLARNLNLFPNSAAKNEVFARYVLAASVLSSFNWFLITRSFSNSFEMILTTVALSYWPFSTRLNMKSLSIASVACIIRPTNAIIWLIIGIDFLVSKKNSKNFKINVIIYSLIIGVVINLINLLIDYYYYGKLTFPLKNFIKFNLINSYSDFYGINSISFHFLQSLPFILTTYLPFFIFSVFKFPAEKRKLFNIIIISNLGFFSLITHKEFRFIYQLMPFLIIYSSYGIYQFSNIPNTNNGILVKMFKKYFFHLIVIINLAISLFLTQIHERGVIDLVVSLRDDPDVESIGLLTPCHSTPLQSLLHNKDLSKKNHIWYLTCEPPSLNNESGDKIDIKDYKDESDIFYENPFAFLTQNLPPVFNKNLRTPGKYFKYEWPTHLIFFESLEKEMKEYLKDSKYEECDRFFNTWFHWDSRRQGDIIVYCKWPWD